MEIQLKKRWSSEYKWGRKQADIWDLQTNFIYSISEFDEVNKEIYNRFSTHKKFQELRNYGLNRWYNFWSAQAVEFIFTSHPLVRQVKNAMDREKDLFINGIAFDHKTSVYPKGYNVGLKDAQIQLKELAKWLYINQSSQQRIHLKNRLFVVLYKNDGEHWRLKAELGWIKLLVDEYLDSFSTKNLIELSHRKGVVKCDIIFGVR